MSATRASKCCALVALFLLFGSACDGGRSGTQSVASGSASDAPSSGSATASGSPRGMPRDLETAAREAAAAVRGLDHAIAAADKHLAKAPSSTAAYQQLVGALLARSSGVGRVSDLDRVVALGEKLVELRPDYGKGYLLRATTRAAVHRFPEALADLDQAEKLGVASSVTRSQRASILMGLGRIDEAHQLFRAHRTAIETNASLMYEAVALGRMGRLQEADALFDKALDVTRSMSPIAMASFQFERGAMWHRAGDEAQAKRYYRAALASLPQHAHAAAHLAEMIPPKEAKPMLEKVLEHSDDPELLALLGDVNNAITAGSGNDLIERARKGYAALMAKHPLAFADHAGWFYLGVKDADRAVEVAELNLKARPVPEAFELTVRALLAAGESDEACVVAERGLELKYPSVGLQRSAADAYAACGRSQPDAG